MALEAVGDFENLTKTILQAYASTLEVNVLIFLQELSAHLDFFNRDVKISLHWHRFLAETFQREIFGHIAG